LKVVFADVDPGTCTMAAATVARLITPRTCAVVPTHLYGLPCDMEGILSLAAARDAVVIEDCAHALGAAEELRVTSEQLRRQAEESREHAEYGRASGELARDAAETLRRVAEQTRIAADLSRQAAEGARQAAESARSAHDALRDVLREVRTEIRAVKRGRSVRSP
jgi:methyl-accepting chemotaxis protein